MVIRSRLRWLGVALFVLASIVQPLQQCGTQRWVVNLGWALGWVMFPFFCGLVALLAQGSNRERLAAVVTLAILIAYGRAVMWEAVRLCRPELAP